LGLDRHPEISKFFDREPSARTGEDGVTHRHVLVDQAGNGWQRDLPGEHRSTRQPPGQGFAQQRIQID